MLLLDIFSDYNCDMWLYSLWKKHTWRRLYLYWFHWSIWCVAHFL